jgi:ubiquinone/menaquinone biosynthesis C-methylase UbiE
MHEKRFNREVERLRDPARLARLEVERVVNLSLENLEDARTVLDIGVGSGVFAEAFTAKGLQVHGVDVNPEMVSTASAFVPSGIFSEGSAEKLPYENATFDLSFMGLLLHETDNALVSLREAYRVTKKRLSVLEWVYSDQPFGPPLADRLSGEQIISLAQQAGFMDMQTLRLQYLVLYRCNVT